MGVLTLLALLMISRKLGNVYQEQMFPAGTYIYIHTWIYINTVVSSSIHGNCRKVFWMVEVR